MELYDQHPFVHVFLTLTSHLNNHYFLFIVLHLLIWAAYALFGLVAVLDYYEMLRADLQKMLIQMEKMWSCLLAIQFSHPWQVQCASGVLLGQVGLDKGYYSINLFRS